MDRIYHYTKFEKAMSILESGTLRMYNVRSQSDEYEAVYMGNQLCEVLLHYFALRHKEFTYETVQGLGACMLFVAKYLCDSTTAEKIIEQVISSEDQSNFFRRLLDDLSGRESKAFICSCSDSPRNSYLWKEYADSQNGVVFEFSVSDLKESMPGKIGLAKVKYQSVESIAKDLMTFVKKSVKPNQTIEEVIKKVIGHKIQEVFSMKETKYRVESEVRLLADYDSKFPVHEIYSDRTREYILFPEQGDMFYKRIHRIYIKRLLQEKKKYVELLNFCNKNSISITKL